MNLPVFIKAKYAKQTAEFTQSRAFAALESGTVGTQDYDEFFIIDKIEVENSKSLAEKVFVFQKFNIRSRPRKAVQRALR